MSVTRNYLSGTFHSHCSIRSTCNITIDHIGYLLRALVTSYLKVSINVTEVKAEEMTVWKLCIAQRSVV